jgi:tRNA(Ile)-lysidine synthase
LTYCRENNVPYGIDETNETDIYERNRIRKAFNALSLEEKESEHKRIQKINKQHKDKKKLVHKEYEL